jgi:hypothetical protein
MDWGTGIGLDVTAQDWPKWLFDYFEECDLLYNNEN